MMNVKQRLKVVENAIKGNNQKQEAEIDPSLSPDERYRIMAAQKVPAPKGKTKQQRDLPPEEVEAMYHKLMG